jgi:hypothetical protein
MNLLEMKKQALKGKAQEVVNLKLKKKQKKRKKVNQ